MVVVSLTVSLANDDDDYNQEEKQDQGCQGTNNNADVLLVKSFLLPFSLRTLSCRGAHCGCCL